MTRAEHKCEMHVYTARQEARKQERTKLSVAKLAIKTTALPLAKGAGQVGPLLMRYTYYAQSPSETRENQNVELGPYSD